VFSCILSTARQEAQSSFTDTDSSICGGHSRRVFGQDSAALAGSELRLAELSEPAFRQALGSFQEFTKDCFFGELIVGLKIQPVHNVEGELMPPMFLTPAAQYLRMSTDQQQFSLANQAAAIARYAEVRGFEVVRSYQDAGKSGVLLKHRNGLRDLLADVMSGNVNYKVVLVYAVSRWGRFQDADEAAHYEFLCRDAGVQVRYCAEPFENDGAVPHYLAKVLKRVMAAEYSRELGVKGFECQKRFVKLGFRMGSQPGYGFRRMTLSANGKPKGLLKPGELKALISDRVTLVLGPATEVRNVQKIYSMCLKQRMGCSQIARELSQSGMTRQGLPWTRDSVREILTNPKYAGFCVWNRTTQRLGAQARPVAPEHWLSKSNAFPAIVSKASFDRVQARFARTSRNIWSDQELVSKLKALLAKKGYLAQRLIQHTKGMPGVATYFKRFGRSRGIYALAGYNPPENLFKRSISRLNSLHLRDVLIREITDLFPGRVKHFQSPGKQRAILQLDDVPVSVIICPTRRHQRDAPFWGLVPVLAESGYITLVCMLNAGNNGFDSFHLFPDIDKVKPCRLREDSEWLSRGERLKELTQLCDKVLRLSTRR
jgi:DNA invertase Pin-like site-specific DNA recombinase